MNDTTHVYRQIAIDPSLLDRSSVRRVLLLYEEKITFIGDCCVRMNKLRYLKSFLSNAYIHLNFTDRSNYELSEGLLKNHPYIDRCSLMDWSGIDFTEYDVIFCISYDEQRILEFLSVTYGDRILGGEWKPAVFSVSELLLVRKPDPVFIFPVYEDLLSHLMSNQPGELYISDEEREWGGDWLRSNGLSEDEKVFVLCDSAGARVKLLRMEVYFQILESLCQRPDVKVLVFDERNLGKEAFYKRWLSPSAMKKMIFSKGFTLRQNLSLIASKYVRLVMGPCTGIMHCASSIYNCFLRKGMAKEDIPLMITYTGQYSKENKSANFWWGNSPLINCLLLREKDGVPEMSLLSSLPDGEKEPSATLPCSLYTSQMLLDFIMKELDGRRTLKPTDIYEKV